MFDLVRPDLERPNVDFQGDCLKMSCFPKGEAASGGKKTSERGGLTCWAGFARVELEVFKVF